MKNKRVKLLIAHDVLRGREEMARVSEEETFEFEELMPGKFTRYERFALPSPRSFNFHMNKKWLEG